MSEKKDKFHRIKKSMAKKFKAHAEAEASENPIKFMEKNKEPSIKKAKGVII